MKYHREESCNNQQVQKELDAISKTLKMDVKFMEYVAKRKEMDDED